MRTIHLAAVLGLGALALVALLAVATPSAATSVIASSGPLDNIYIGEDLACQVYRADDAVDQFYPRSTEPGDCGTFLYVTDTLGSTFYAPDFAAHGTTATSAGLGSYSTYVATSQTTSGSGTRTDPYTITTKVRAGNIVVTELDAYVNGREDYRTDITLENTGSLSSDIILWRAADCYLGGSDSGYGWYEAASRSIACSANPDNSPPGRFEQWRPRTAGSHYYHESYNTVWSRIGANTAFPDTCRCTSRLDNGAGLSWEFTLVAGTSLTFSHDTVFSLTGITMEAAFGDDPSHTTCEDSAIRFWDLSTIGGAPGLFTYRWDFGDGATSTSPVPSHTYAAAGVYTVTLEVRNEDGLTATATRTVTSVGDPNCCPDLAPLGIVSAQAGDFVRFHARATDFEDDTRRFTITPEDMPLEARFDEAAGTFGWLTGLDDAGTRLFHVTVTDTFHPGVVCDLGQLELILSAPPERGEVPDTDRDGVADSQDNCPSTPNRYQEDADYDGMGDACQAHSEPLGPGDGDDAATLATRDLDGDGFVDAADVCPRVPDPAQADHDLDHVGDACDADADGDGTAESARDPAAILDNCPLVANPDQADADRDGFGDACDGSLGLRTVPRAGTVAPVGEPAGTPAATGTALAIGGVAFGVLLVAALAVLVGRWGAR